MTIEDCVNLAIDRISIEHAHLEDIINEATYIATMRLRLEPQVAKIQVEQYIIGCLYNERQRLFKEAGYGL